jgi:hypothetical protein
MEFEDQAEQSLPRPCREMNDDPSGHTISPHPSSREGHQFHREVDLRFFSYLAAVLCAARIAMGMTSATRAARRVINVHASSPSPSGLAM